MRERNRNGLDTIAADLRRAAPTVGAADRERSSVRHTTSSNESAAAISRSPTTELRVRVRISGNKKRPGH
jgi:hypothetical protein